MNRHNKVAVPNTPKIATGIAMTLIEVQGCQNTWFNICIKVDLSAHTQQMTHGTICFSCVAARTLIVEEIDTIAAMVHSTASYLTLSLLSWIERQPRPTQPRFKQLQRKNMRVSVVDYIIRSKVALLRPLGSVEVRRDMSTKTSRCGATLSCALNFQPSRNASFSET